MDLLARSCQRALCGCLCFCFVSCSCDICLTLCLPPSHSSWCLFYELERNVCFCPHRSGKTGLLMRFLGIQLSCSLPQYWSLLWFSKRSENSTIWLLLLGFGAQLLLHPLLQCVGILTSMCWFAGSDLYTRYPWDAVPRSPSTSGRWWQLRLGVCGHGPALGPSLWSIFSEKWQILGTSNVVFKMLCRNTLIPAA